MATTYRSQFLAVMRENERRMTALFRRLADSIAAQIARAADADGTVPLSSTYALQSAAGDAAARLFLGRQGERWAPFDVLPDGTVLPLSPYTRVLWASIEAATRVSVEQHAAIMAQRLPADLVAHLRRARRDPFAYARQVREQAAAFTPNPLARYDPAHTWVDPNGYTLSERIWRTAGETRRRLDAFLDERIRAGQGSLAMSRALEAFLLPGRTLRTKAPYGVDASYDAMRLARTEITRAAAQASEMAAAMNPFVVGIRVVLSGSHPKPDICDEAAAAGPWPKDRIPAEYQIPMHPHCLCSYRYELTDNAAAVLRDLRDEVRAERAVLVEMIGPLQVASFVALLLGRRMQTMEAAA